MPIRFFPRLPQKIILVSPDELAVVKKWINDSNELVVICYLSIKNVKEIRLILSEWIYGK